MFATKFNPAVVAVNAVQLHSRLKQASGSVTGRSAMRGCLTRGPSPARIKAGFSTCVHFQGNIYLHTLVPLKKKKIPNPKTKGKPAALSGLDPGASVLRSNAVGLGTPGPKGGLAVRRRESVLCGIQARSRTRLTSPPSFLSVLPSHTHTIPGVFKSDTAVFVLPLSLGPTRSG